MTTSFKPETIAILQEKLHMDNVKKRDGQGNKKFDYLEAWYVIDLANKIFGYDGWNRQTEYEHIGTVKIHNTSKNTDAFHVAYSAKVRIVVGDIIREGCGFGNGQDSFNELNAHELALKEAESDAMKRAFSTFGNPFGLALYDKERKEVDTSLPKADVKPIPKQDTKPKEESESYKKLEKICLDWVGRIDAAVDKGELTQNEVNNKWEEFKSTKNYSYLKDFPKLGNSIYEKIVASGNKAKSKF